MTDPGAADHYEVLQISPRADQDTIHRVFRHLAKRYHPELGTTKVLAIFTEPDREVRISKLSFVEVQSVFAMKVRSGIINQGEAVALRTRLMAEIAAG